MNDTMKLTIRRGAHEIGGSCIELEAAGRRIVLDLGMPLVAPWDRKLKLESREFTRLSTAEVRKAGLLPAVPGLYDDEERGVDALVLSHPHQDHYGLIRHLHPDIPVYLSEGAKRILAVSDLFLPLKANLKETVLIEDRKPVAIGPFTVTPYLVDHSAFDAMALQVDAGGRRIFYSGDFRGHGRKARLFETLLARAPGSVDALLMEGTTLGGGHEIKTEAALEEDFVSLARRTSGNLLVSASGQNIDRLVTLYRAAVRTRRTLAVDLYTAHILAAVARGRLPRPSREFKALRVLFPKTQMRTLYRAERQDMVRAMAPFEVKPAEIDAQPGRFITLWRAGAIPELSAVKDWSGAMFVHSQYAGYLKDDSFARTREFLEARSIPIEHVHTSGHASPTDLARLVRAIAPKALVPIHTFQPTAYAGLWPAVRVLPDGTAYSL